MPFVTSAEVPRAFDLCSMVRDAGWASRAAQLLLTVRRGDAAFQGRISYDAVTELFQVSGGTAQASGNSPGDGRVRATINPKPKTGPPAAPPVTLKPEDGVDTKRGELGAAR